MRTFRLRRGLIIGAVAAMLLAGAPVVVLAQGACANQDLGTSVSPWDPRAPFIQLSRLQMLGCLGGKEDESQVAREIHKALEAEVELDELRPAVDRALQIAGAYAQQLFVTHSAEVLGRLSQQVALARTLLGTGQTPAVPTAWDVVAGKLFGVSESLQAALETSCASPAEVCRTQFIATREVVRVAALTRHALFVSERPEMLPHLAETTRRAQQWEHYFEQSRSQYWWELLLNGAVMPDTRVEVEGTKRGFREVPSSQWMLLHPTAAFRYVDAEPEGNRFAAVAVVDVLGYNRWRWKADGTMGFAFGASLVLSVADHVTANDLGWGAMLHVDHKWSIGATFDGDATVVLVSADVAKIWTRASDVRKRAVMTGQ